MGKVKQIEIKNWTYCFYNDIINIGEICSNFLKVNKKSFKNTDVYYIGYITNKKIDDCENIYSVTPLYLIIGKVDGHTEKKKNRSKYLVFDSTDENKEVLKKCTELCHLIKNVIEIIQKKPQKELTLVKQVHQKNVCFDIIGILRMLDLYSNRMFVTNVRMHWWLLMN